MSSYITIPKICDHCNERFIAKTTVTKFCSQKCAAKAYKLGKRKEKITQTQNDEYRKSIGLDVNNIQSKEFLSVNEACQLLGVSRMSLYRYFKAEVIHPIKLGGRVIIKRQTIDNLFKS